MRMINAYSNNVIVCYLEYAHSSTIFVSELWNIIKKFTNLVEDYSCVIAENFCRVFRPFCHPTGVVNPLRPSRVVDDSEHMTLCTTLDRHCRRRRQNLPHFNSLSL